MNKSDSFAHTHSAGHVIGGGRYSLHVPLGESDLVWLAQDEVDKRLVVIRFLPREVREDARALDALKTRVSAASKVTHPNVCRVIEWYEAPGVELFVVSEYLEGRTLAQTTSKWSELAPRAWEIASGLAALHEAGVLHTGVEPCNVILTQEGARLLNTGVSGVLRSPMFVPSALKHPERLRCFSPGQLAG